MAYYLVLLTLAFQSIVVVFAARTDCEWDLLDKAAANFVFVGTNSSMPTTSDALDDVCKTAEDSIASCEQFAKDCTTGLETAMLTIFLDAAKKDRNERCKTNRDEYLNVASCLQKKAATALRKCNVKQTGFLQAVLKQDKEDRVALVCCYQKRYEACVNKASEICGEEHAEYTKKVVNIMSEELKDTACRKYVKNPDKCDDLPRVKPIKKPTHSTMVPGLVKIIATA